VDEIIIFPLAEKIPGYAIKNPTASGVLLPANPGGYFRCTNPKRRHGIQPATRCFSTIRLFQGEYSMQKSTLRDLYIDELKDLYSAETQMVKALPKMAKAASSDELRQGFEEHLRQTSEHVSRLERIFGELQQKPTGKKCMGMEGLIKEGTETIQEGYSVEVLDAALIGVAQRVEHYEIAAYGTARALAELLGETEQASLLADTLQEEEQTDEKLTELSGEINELASGVSKKGASTGETVKVKSGKAA
jgi:ferritin-like metal-binding protein YciE